MGAALKKKKDQKKKEKEKKKPRHHSIFYMLEKGLSGHGSEGLWDTQIFRSRFLKPDGSQIWWFLQNKTSRALSENIINF